jgi:hypothetical protein
MPAKPSTDATVATQALLNTWPMVHDLCPQYIHLNHGDAPASQKRKSSSRNKLKGRLSETRLLRASTPRVILRAAQASLSEGVPPLRTCPACHRAVPDAAATCPHPGCGHRFGTSRTVIKRPPPPPAHVHVVGNDAHQATTRPIEPPPAVAATSSRRPLLVWLIAALVGCGAVAAGLLAYLPRSQEKEATPAAGWHALRYERRDVGRLPFIMSTIGSVWLGGVLSTDRRRAIQIHFSE